MTVSHRGCRGSGLACNPLHSIYLAMPWMSSIGVIQHMEASAWELHAGCIATLHLGMYASTKILFYGVLCMQCCMGMIETFAGLPPCGGGPQWPG